MKYSDIFGQNKHPQDEMTDSKAEPKDYSVQKEGKDIDIQNSNEEQSLLKIVKLYSNQIIDIANKYFPTLVPTIEKRWISLRKNLFHDMVFGNSFIYPIQGALEVVTTRVYWKYIAVFGVSYVITFFVIGGLYYLTLLPIVLSWSMLFLGPIGFVLAHLQWVLQTNALTSIISSKLVLPFINDRIYDMALVMNGGEDFLNKGKLIRKVKSKTKKDLKIDSTTSKEKESQWIVRKTWSILKFFRNTIITISLTLLSMVPLIGPPIVNQIMAPSRSFSYMTRYFYLKGFNHKEAKDFQYENYGHFVCFGMASGILEFLPFISIITMASNTIGAAKWSLALNERENKLKKNE
ncbi:uncharacterized protein NDAI_0A08570 [Naumovozyma dairenensis CBS 421]|uniref:Outer spore wall protein RRT8 n=1 Tax=Naumovozyma dairenensis (strain ATCC 10597 / BCRC 20456 / CBS 421 / NBRC 0211 / NRRL Y-12639) TaxID=1071378 RepID=G0W5C2_NAUDC|nr:hypothetical protein NDAI_0A08570 [Naumovozyma dairenensis CBS 421]CCD23010.1 hypothetical protein NDAI_0A08570 [Naumovozyma dairenensis CBS 421]